MQILHNAKEVGLSVQVNTTASAFNVDLLPDMVPFIQEVNTVQWSVFFLVPTGRAQAHWMISPERHEAVFNWLYDLSQNAPFDIKATAASPSNANARKPPQGSGSPSRVRGSSMQTG